jgi:hypothetical protein
MKRAWLRNVALMVTATIPVSKAVAADRPSIGIQRFQPDSNACDGDAKRFANGQIKHCRLGRDHVMASGTLPAGSEVSLDESGALSEAVLGNTAKFYGQEFPRTRHAVLQPLGKTAVLLVARSLHHARAHAVGP